MHVVLHDVGQQHGHQQHQHHLVQNFGKGREEGHVSAFLYQREADGHQESRDEVGKEGVGGHLLEVAAQLLRDNGCRSGTGRDDTHEDGLHQNQAGSLHAEAQHEAHERGNEEKLEHAYPEMPLHRSQLTEVDLAESDEKDKKHEQRQDGREER